MCLCLFHRRSHLVFHVLVLISLVWIRLNRWLWYDNSGSTLWKSYIVVMHVWASPIIEDIQMFVSLFTSGKVCDPQMGIKPETWWTLTYNDWVGQRRLHCGYKGSLVDTNLNSNSHLDSPPKWSKDCPLNCALWSTVRHWHCGWRYTDIFQAKLPRKCFEPQAAFESVTFWGPVKCTNHWATESYKTLATSLLIILDQLCECSFCFPQKSPYSVTEVLHRSWRLRIGSFVWGYVTSICH